MMSEVMHWAGNLPLEIRDRSNKLVARLMVHSERESFGHVQGIVCVYDGYSERVIDQTGFGAMTEEPESLSLILGLMTKEVALRIYGASLLHQR